MNLPLYERITVAPCPWPALIGPTGRCHENATRAAAARPGLRVAEALARTVLSSGVEVIEDHIAVHFLVEGAGAFFDVTEVRQPPGPGLTVVRSFWRLLP
jgi:hypothetical protein